MTKRRPIFLAAPTVEVRPVPGIPGYYAGVDGSIWSERPLGVGRGTWSRRWCRLCTRESFDGYLVIPTGQRRCSGRVNRLVAMAFHGLPQPGQEAAHLNGVHTDNRPDNLAWKTPAENAADRERHGTIVRGERVGTHKLTAAQVAEIRAAYVAGRVSQQSLADRFGVSQVMVSKIVRREWWASVG